MAVGGYFRFESKEEELLQVNIAYFLYFDWKSHISRTVEGITGLTSPVTLDG